MFTAIRPPESTAERHGSAARIAVHSEPSFGGHPTKDMHPNNDDLTTRLRKKLATERRRRLSIQNKLSSAETKARDLEARLSKANNEKDTLQRNLNRLSPKFTARVHSRPPILHYNDIASIEQIRAGPLRGKINRISVPLGTYYCPLSPGYIWRGRPAGEDMEIQLTEWIAPDGEIIKTDPKHIKNEDDKVRKRANW